MSTAFPRIPLARLVSSDGGEGLRVSQEVGAELEQRHAEPHRRYHTAEHVAEVQAELIRLHRQVRGGGIPDDEVVIAAMFHDAVYDVHASAGTSEAASADLAVDRFRDAGVRRGSIMLEEVPRLILLTAGHTVDPDDAAGALLVDADLWILSSPPERYDRYAADVREEYAHVPDDLWRTGRGAVLQHFVDTADDLYSYGPDDDRAARRARAVANLTRELAALG